MKDGNPSIIKQSLSLLSPCHTGELTQIEGGRDPGDYPGGDGGSDSDEGALSQAEEGAEEEEEESDEEADMVVLDPEHVRALSRQKVLLPVILLD
jgi:hypothetical protein